MAGSGEANFVDQPANSFENDPPASMLRGRSDPESEIVATDDDPIPDDLFEILTRSRQLGFLGPGPVADHVEHAERFRKGLAALVGPGARIADIGAGGGVPSLPILAGSRKGEMANAWSMVLVDAAAKRCAFLAWAIVELGLQQRASVARARVEQWAHDPQIRFGFDAVIARGFGPPAFTVECGVGLLTDGGYLLISEPPGLRCWPTDELRDLGLCQVDVDGDSLEGLAAFVRRDELARLPDRIPRSAKQQRSSPVLTMVPTRDATR